jgi:hypothetical protein
MDTSLRCYAILCHHYHFVCNSHICAPRTQMYVGWTCIAVIIAWVSGLFFQRAGKWLAVHVNSAPLSGAINNNRWSEEIHENMFSVGIGGATWTKLHFKKDLWNNKRPRHIPGRGWMMHNATGYRKGLSTTNVLWVQSVSLRCYHTVRSCPLDATIQSGRCPWQTILVHVWNTYTIKHFFWGHCPPCEIRVNVQIVFCAEFFLVKFDNILLQIACVTVWTIIHYQWFISTWYIKGTVFLELYMQLLYQAWKLTYVFRSDVCVGFGEEMKWYIFI